MGSLQERIEDAIIETQEAVVKTDTPEDPYKHGFRDGFQHAISAVRGVLEEERE